MSGQFAVGKKARGICDVCGFAYRLKQLREVVKNRIPTGLRACPKCWDPHHPQDDLGLYRIEDAQALQDPRPDHKELAAVRALRFQIPTAQAVARLEPVGVSVS